MSFFINNLAILGRGIESSRGFFEVLVPVFSQQTQGSALSLAVGALATKLFVLWRDRTIDSPAANKSMSLALASLRNATTAPSETGSYSTILAALTLQFHQNISAVFGRHDADRVHHDGAVALCRQQLPATDSPYGKFVRTAILHTEVSYAIRGKQSLPDETVSWMLSRGIIENPSTRLDRIGISIANLQHKFLRDPERRHTSIHSILEEAAELENALTAWEQNVPYSWRPYALRDLDRCNPPLESFTGICDVYLSVQVAAVWSVWRSYQLILFQIRQSCIFTARTGVDSYQGDQFRALSIIDSICQSVPFFLGNKMKRSSFHDFADKDLWAPSYHDLGLPKETIQEYMYTSDLLSKQDHVMHTIVQGPWHLMNHLSHLLSMLSGTHGWVLTRVLRPGQWSWIRGQLVRTARLLDIETNAPVQDPAPSAPQPPLKITSSVDHTDASVLAGRIRAGLRVTSGT